MSKRQKPDLTILSEKGQVVIPAEIRTKMGLKPKTKFLVYQCDDSVILKKLEVPDLSKELEAMYKKIDANIAKYGQISQEEIDEEIHRYRKEKAEKTKRKQ
jgi:AbrB family looped-hinge helix DNA binding protein